MTLGKLTPIFSELASTRDRLNRLFGQEDVWESGNAIMRADWLPAVDVAETDNEFTIRAELPGIEPKDVSVTVDNNVLTLKGERRADKEIKKENYYRMERAYGAFSRSFTLPSFVDTGNVRAEFKNGLLVLTLPKKSAGKAKTVEIHAA
jgi:HSP20 family protein